MVTTFRYQGDAIVAESKDGVLMREYTVDDAGTIHKMAIPAGQTGAGTYLITWNGHGDALALYRIETSGSLTLANSYTYSTWGSPTTATHNSIPDLGFRFLYVGAYDVQWDGTYGLPLIYMHARHYSPTIGRFLQPDPSRLDAQLFVYAENSPVSRIDPSGEVAFCLVPIIAILCVATARTILIGTARLIMSALRAHKPTGSITSTMVRNLTRISRGSAFRQQKVAEAARRYWKDIKSTQCHHVWPRWLGGATKFVTIRIPTHYHKAITAAFREVPEYQRYIQSGLLPPTWRRLEIMMSVYSELPLDDPSWQLGWGC